MQRDIQNSVSLFSDVKWVSKAVQKQIELTFVDGISEQFIVGCINNGVAELFSPNGMFVDSLLKGYSFLRENLDRNVSLEFLKDMYSVLIRWGTGTFRTKNLWFEGNNGTFCIKPMFIERELGRLLTPYGSARKSFAVDLYPLRDVVHHLSRLMNGLELIAPFEFYNTVISKMVVQKELARHGFLPVLFDEVHRTKYVSVRRFGYDFYNVHGDFENKKLEAVLNKEIGSMYRRQR